MARIAEARRDRQQADGSRLVSITVLSAQFRFLASLISRADKVRLDLTIDPHFAGTSPATHIFG